MLRGRLDILLIEDDPNDVFFVRDAIAKSGRGHRLYAVTDGNEAIAYLKGQGQYANREAHPVPNIVLTDLKMPGMDGFEFLQWLKEHPECGIIPAIVFSSSRHDADVRKAYRLGANAYIMKPTRLAELVDVLHSTYEFWSHCERPPMPKHC